jgi:hypothetical protein
LAPIRDLVVNRREPHLTGVSLAYLVMFAIVFDYPRWISNWAESIIGFARTGVHFALNSRFVSPDANVQRARAAMADMRFLKTDHQWPEFGQAKPLRHLAAQHAAFGIGSAGIALASDHEDEAQAFAVRALEKDGQRPVCARLRHAVEV